MSGSFSEDAEAEKVVFETKDPELSSFYQQTQDNYGSSAFRKHHYQKMLNLIHDNRLSYSYRWFIALAVQNHHSSKKYSDRTRLSSLALFRPPPALPVPVSHLPIY